VFPYRENGFFYRVADARLIFDGDGGDAGSVVLEVEGHRRTAARIDPPS